MVLTKHGKCFVQEQVDDDWVWKIKNRVGPWVAQKTNSGLWDCVNIYSQYLGILKKGLIRKDFAELIVAIRPKGLKEGKTKEQLKGSMDQCRITLKLDSIENYKKDSERGKIVNELKQMFDSPVPASRNEASAYTVESRMREFLQKRVATDRYLTICQGETYCGYTTTLSLERYASEKFKNSRQPSFIYVVECFEDKITDDTISLMTGRFGTDSKIKLVIASSSGFDERVKKLATERNVRLIRVNPQYDINENNILTPRMDGISSVHNYEHKMLSGKVPMTVPMVILDGDYITTSLTDFLKRNDIPINSPGIAHAPVLTSEFIENVVSEIIEKDVRKYVAMLKRCGLSDKVPYCIIDPYKYAERDNLKIYRSDLSKQRHLGHIDIKNKVVRLSDKLGKGDPRDRFSMAHEYGHHKLHSHPKFAEFMKREVELEGEAVSDIWEKHWLEVQANRFASFMLMPREIATLLYDLYWRKWFKGKQVKPMLVGKSFYWDKDFQNVVAPVSRHMGVSKEAMKNRLCELGLLIDITEIDQEKAV